MTEREPLVRAKHLVKHYPIRRPLAPWLKSGNVRAVDGVDLSINAGTTLGLVGESGCGKSTLGRLLLRLVPPTSGAIEFDGVDLLGLPPAEMRVMRRRMQIVFQDPYGSLDPYKSIGWSIEEPLRIFGEEDAGTRRAAVHDLMTKVGLKPDAYDRYPHEFSGGQRQRISIARAIALMPSFVVCDEPVSALDVSVQAQIINLLKDLQQSLHLTYLFVSHDLSVVAHIADEVSVMYLGRVVEHGPKRQVFSAPFHPYTKALLAAMPTIATRELSDVPPIKGEASGSGADAAGCRFRNRCPLAFDACKEIDPTLTAVGERHMAACHLADASSRS